MWRILEKTKELAAKMENQLNEATGIETSTPSNKETLESRHEDELNDAWNDDFEDDTFINTPTQTQHIEHPEVFEAPSTQLTNPEDTIMLDTSTSVEVGVGNKELEDKQELAGEMGVKSPDCDAAEMEPSTTELPKTLNFASSSVSSLDNMNQKDESEGRHDNIPSTSGEVVQDSSPVKDVVSESEEKGHPTNQVEEKNDAAGWEEDLYIDNEDDDEEDEEEEEDCAPQLPEALDQPPTTISIPNANRELIMAPSLELDEIRKSYEMQLAQLKLEMHQILDERNQFQDQLAKKSQQIESLAIAHNAEKEELRNKVKETKEEAKRRILAAKERVEAIEKASKKNAAIADELQMKEETIQALREEGQKLAKKQSEMEKAVRTALGESRELTALLEEEKSKKDKALEKITNLEFEVKKTKEDLNAARKGESQASKLENELQNLKEEIERKDAANMSAQQQIKELKLKNKELKKDMEDVEKGAIAESKRESIKLKREHGDMLGEMETKLRVAEREASIREDALRTEVSELRKRWQDAVRRADALSMDVQNSTSPLLRQLESMERQNRVRATAWADLETKLRSELENYVIENEKLTKERNEYKSSSNRLTRVSKELENELNLCKTMIEDQKIKITNQDSLIEEMEKERRILKEEWSEVERLANEGVTKVRNDMMKTVLESEERHQAQLKSMEKDLTEERKKRSLLQRQVEELLENAGMEVVPNPTSNGLNGHLMPKSVEKKLRSAQSQGSILVDALSGLNGDEDVDDVEDEDLDAKERQQMGANSFAAMEQLNQKLKEVTVELEALRHSLTRSERVRESLLEELGDTRVAKEKLRLFEAKVQELAVENHQKEIEILALKEDIAEIRQLYRSQLNGLLEEKAAMLTEAINTPGKNMLTMTPMQTPVPDRKPEVDDLPPFSSEAEPQA
jgi:hypothetical protein